MKYPALVVLGVALSVGAHADGSMIGIRNITPELAGVQIANPQLKRSVEIVSGQGEVLVVDYPAPGSDPAARDIWFDVENPNWSTGKSIVFNARAGQAIKLSVSFMDRNRVVYTSWTELRAGEWQTVQIRLSEIRPNPYFQPPDAKRGAPLDVSEVTRIGVAPQDPGAGRLAIGQLVLFTDDYWYGGRP
jgi:hypothetical protein